jgi:hypothetical protein
MNLLSGFIGDIYNVHEICTAWNPFRITKPEAKLWAVDYAKLHNMEAVL